MELQAKFYDKILMIQVKGEMTVENLSEWEQMFLAQGAKLGSLILLLDEAKVEEKAAQMLTAMRESLSKKKMKVHYCAQEKNSFPAGLIRTNDLIEALDQVDSADSRRVIQLFSKEEQFRGLKRQIDEASESIKTLLGAQGDRLDIFIRRFEDKFAKLSREQSVLEKSISAVEKQRAKGSDSLSEGGTPKEVESARAKLLALIKKAGVL